MEIGSFGGENQMRDGGQVAVCHNVLQGKSAFGESSQHQQSESDKHDGSCETPDASSRNPYFGERITDDSLRTSQGDGNTNKGNGSVSGECRSNRSFCRNFLRDKCSSGVSCPHLHSEYTAFITPGYDWCVKFHQEIVATSNNLGGDARNIETAKSVPTSLSKQNLISSMDANASVLTKEGLADMIPDLRWKEGAEMNSQVLKTSKKRKRRSKCNERQLGSGDSAIVVPNKSIAEANFVKNVLTIDHSLQTSEEATSRSKRNLLVLDVNGLLADIVSFNRDIAKCKPAATLSGKAVFKRLFCEEFIDFCFERFNVGLWSSRTRKNVEKVVDLLLGERKKRLLFCWNQSHCTNTGYKTLENKDKPLVLKELKKLWEKDRPEVPWDRGYYDQTNTVLLDDSPYKALCNPPHTAIFPHPFTVKNLGDTSLGPEGDLRRYLERLAGASDVQKFICENHFGQKPINKINLRWKDFYSKIANRNASSPKGKKAASLKPTRENNSQKQKKIQRLAQSQHGKTTTTTPIVGATVAVWGDPYVSNTSPCMQRDLSRQGENTSNTHTS